MDGVRSGPTYNLFPAGFLLLSRAEPSCAGSGTKLWVGNLFTEQRAGVRWVGGIVRLFQGAERAGGSGVLQKLSCSLSLRKKKTQE